MELAEYFTWISSTLWFKHASLQELQQFKGIGEHVQLIKSSDEFGYRINRALQPKMGESNLD